MPIYLDKRAMLLKGLEPLSEILTLLPSSELMEIFQHILYGYRSKLVSSVTFDAVDESGSDHLYRLTITLDSLAGSEKNESGMTTTAKPGGSIEPVR